MFILIIIALGCTQHEKKNHRRTTTEEKSLSYKGLVSPIRLNHVGFLPDAKKFFVADDPPEKTFQLLKCHALVT